MKKAWLLETLLLLISPVIVFFFLQNQDSETKTWNVKIGITLVLVLSVILLLLTWIERIDKYLGSHLLKLNIRKGPNQDEKGAQIEGEETKIKEPVVLQALLGQLKTENLRQRLELTENLLDDIHKEISKSQKSNLQKPISKQTRKTTKDLSGKVLKKEKSPIIGEGTKVMSLDVFSGHDRDIAEKIQKNLDEIKGKGNEESELLKWVLRLKEKNYSEGVVWKVIDRYRDTPEEVQELLRAIIERQLKLTRKRIRNMGNSKTAVNLKGMIEEKADKEKPEMAILLQDNSSDSLKTENSPDSENKVSLVDEKNKPNKPAPEDNSAFND